MNYEGIAALWTQGIVPDLAPRHTTCPPTPPIMEGGEEVGDDRISLTWALSEGSSGFTPLPSTFLALWHWRARATRHTCVFWGKRFRVSNCKREEMHSCNGVHYAREMVHATLLIRCNNNEIVCVSLRPPRLLFSLPTH